MSTFLLIAKAGGSNEAAENTCEAIQSAARLRASSEIEVGVEIDLRLSADGNLVALHDARLERTTNGRGLVREHRLHELRQLRAGASGERVPSLPEVLEAVGDRPLLLDLHDDDVAVAAALCRELSGVPRGCWERIWVASEHTRVVNALRRLEPNLQTAATKREAWTKLLLGWAALSRFAPRGHVWIVPERHAGLPIVTERFISDARAAGDAVWPFVVDDAVALERLRKWGAGGCLTSRPGRLIDALAKPAPRSADRHG